MDKIRALSFCVAVIVAGVLVYTNKPLEAFGALVLVLVPSVLDRAADKKTPPP